MHYNVQINVQKVSDEVPKPLGGGRQVTKVLELAVTADTEAEAYAKAFKMLEAARPEPVKHVHRASCHGARGELQCDEEGF